MKEKREELVKKTTKDELIQFRNEIIKNLNKNNGYQTNSNQ
jgi:hypothetical protein